MKFARVEGNLEKSGYQYVTENGYTTIICDKNEIVECSMGELDSVKSALPDAVIAFKNKVNNDYFSVLDKKSVAIIKDSRETPYHYFLDDQPVDNLSPDYSRLTDSIKNSLEELGLDITVHTAIRRDCLTSEIEKFNVIKNEDLDKLLIDYNKVEDAVKPFIKNFVWRGYTHYIKTDYDNFIEELKTPLNPLHIKGDPDGDTYYKIRGQIVRSNIDNWYKFVSYKFFNNEILDWMLE